MSRYVVRLLVTAFALIAMTMDRTMSEQSRQHSSAFGRGELLVLPRTGAPGPGAPGPGAPAGTRPLGGAGPRAGLVHVPPGYRAERPAPLVVLLHGAGGRAADILPAFRALADATGTILVAPSSRGRTWDVILGAYGPDVERIDEVLRHVFASHAVDPARIAVGGFSDGASYALSLGVINGTLFTHVLAFSPGFLAPTGTRGSPRLFIAHGTHDAVLPIDRCSRRIVPRLRRSGYDILYREFDGGHVVPPDIAGEGFSWFLGQPEVTAR